MINEHLTRVVNELGLGEWVSAAMQHTVVSDIAIDDIAGEPSDPNKLARLGFMFEIQGLSLWNSGVSGEDREPARLAFASAEACWGSLSHFAECHEFEFAKFDGLLDYNSSVFFRLAVAGLLAENTAETRLRLKGFQPIEVADMNWLKQVVHKLAQAFILLVRKNGGWTDISDALDAIEYLRSAQNEYESDFINLSSDEDNQTKSALKLVGFYHLAQMVTMVGEYLQTGENGRTELEARLDTFHRKATECFEVGTSPNSRHFADLIWAGSKSLVRNSLWSHLEGASESLQAFGRELISSRTGNPVLELWPSQQEALRKNLLDSYQRAILVEMPTSAGKTLLAKFAIAQTKALNPTGKIAYIVPTRALVNQVTLDLRRDFASLGYGVELAVPAFELDPSEKALLTSGIDILVTTPEKLDLLIRLSHEAVQDLALVVADEAHNLKDGGRGARLELLLGTIKRERRNCRFLLLSPFLPNGNELVTWLGDDRHLPPIKVDWRPSRRLVAAVCATGRASKRRLSLEALPAADNADITPETIIPIGSREAVPRNLSISSISRRAAIALSTRGGLLVLCRGKGTAAKRAVELANELPSNGQISELAQAVCAYLDAEAGYETDLAQCIYKGVAYHHAGLSQEARWLVERLISSGDVRLVCGTTTLAQGVNFPISSVIVETLKKGEDKLTYTDFWNIAGRAGRALVDTIGVIAFPAENAGRKEQYKEFLREEALEISSQLAALVVAADEIGDTFNLANLRTYPQLSSLLQFLAHAVRVSEGVDLADQLEALLRSSLVYHQASGNSRLLNRFVRLCRSYVRKVSGNQRRILGIADTTGFATPSVLYLMAQMNDQRSFQDPMEWLPSTLFGQDISALKSRIEMIAGVPEMRLGDGKGGPLDPVRTASILRDWVNGDDIISLARKYAHKDVEGESEPKQSEIADFSQYLFSTLITNASWGIGALENLCLADRPMSADDDAAHIPSMIFFGVQTTEAVWLRMAGLPRVAAEGAATIWRQQGNERPQSYAELRSWISSLSNDEWATALPGSNISAEAMKRVWQELSGN